MKTQILLALVCLNGVTASAEPMVAGRTYRSTEPRRAEQSPSVLQGDVIIDEHGAFTSDQETIAAEASYRAVEKVMDLLQVGNYREAYRVADFAVEASGSATAFRARANCASLLRQHQRAIADFQKAFTLSPLFSDLQCIAESQVAMGDLSGAVASCRRLKTFPYQSENDRRVGEKCIELVSGAAVNFLRSQASVPDDDESAR